MLENIKPLKVEGIISKVKYCDPMCSNRKHARACLSLERLPDWAICSWTGWRIVLHAALVSNIFHCLSYILPKWSFHCTNKYKFCIFYGQFCRPYNAILKVIQCQTFQRTFLTRMPFFFLSTKMKMPPPLWWDCPFLIWLHWQDLLLSNNINETETQKSLRESSKVEREKMYYTVLNYSSKIAHTGLRRKWLQIILDSKTCASWHLWNSKWISDFSVNQA